MRTYLDCMPCFLRQALEAAKLAGFTEEEQKAVLDMVALRLPGISMDQAPPLIARMVYGSVDSFTGGKDVYKKIKLKSNKLALELYPKLKKIIEASPEVLLSAVRLAVAGNVIDYGVPSSFNIEQEIEDCLSRDFAVFDFGSFKESLKAAKNILYILDNAGEIVFDKLLIEEIKKPVVSVTRGKAIINDVTAEDAKFVGLDEISTVISSGSDVPGTVPGECTDEFRDYYDKADLIISKGQGNFETLLSEDKPIFFIFKAKCPVVAKHIGCQMGDIILKKSR